MIIVTAYDKKYEEMYKLTSKLTRDLIGMLVVAYPAPVKSDDFQESGVQRAPYKAEVIKRAMEEYNDDIMWLDCDAVLQQRPIVDWTADVIVTVRPPSERKGNQFEWFSDYVNTGVVYVKNNVGGRKFLDMWIEAIPKNKWQSDQGAVNDLLRDYTDFNGLGFVEIDNGVTVQLSTTVMNNNYYFNELTKYARVVHFKGTRGDTQKVKEWFGVQ